MRQENAFRKVGVLGGSFNPIHLGHLVLAETARDSLGLERVIFIPANMPPHKGLSSLAPKDHRLEMVRLAISPNPAFEVSDIELSRGGISYTIETIREIRKQLSAKTEIFFPLGMDTIYELPSWRSIGELVELCTFVPFRRPGVIENNAPLAQALGEKRCQEIIARTIEMPLLDISSSQIRRRVADGRTIKYLVPACVEDYIRQNRLYLH